MTSSQPSPPLLGLRSPSARVPARRALCRPRNQPPHSRIGGFRLILTPVGEDDVAALHAHWNTPQVARWLWDANPVPLQTVADLVTRSIQTFRNAGWGLWAARPATEVPLIGVCGLSPFKSSPGIELLYSLAPAHWSRGLATEAATAVLAYAFDILALPEALATADDGNHPSLRLLTRLGATPAPRVRVGPHTYACYRPQRPRPAPPAPLRLNG